MYTHTVNVHTYLSRDKRRGCRGVHVLRGAVGGTHHTRAYNASNAYNAYSAYKPEWNTTQPRQCIRPVMASSRHRPHDVPHGPAAAEAGAIVDEARLSVEPAKINHDTRHVSQRTCKQAILVEPSPVLWQE